MRWLIPQSAAFQPRQPLHRAADIDIDVGRHRTSERAGRFHHPSRHHGAGQIQRLSAVFLDDVSTVVVEPSLLEKQRLRDPRDLLKVPLLHLRSRPDAWRRWFKVSEVDTPDAIAGPFFDHFFLSLQAAINGLGAAIGPYALIEDDLTAGRLVPPFPDRNIVGPRFPRALPGGGRERARGPHLSGLAAGAQGWPLRQLARLTSARAGAYQLTRSVPVPV